MDKLDVSFVILQITSSNEDAVSALKHPNNKQFLVPTTRASSRRKREGTPLLEHHSVSAVLRTDHLPFEPGLGFVFGREEDDTDFVLGTLEQGISQKHFSIDFNWQSKTLLFRNLSGNGTIWTDPETGQNEKIMTSRAIVGSKQYRVTAGFVDLILQIPQRDEQQQARYNKEVQHLCNEAEKATPTIDGLKLRRPGKATPMIIGQKRKYILGRVIGTGVTAIVHEATDHETGDRYAAKEYTFDRQTEAVLKSMSREISLLQELKHVSIERCSTSSERILILIFVIETYHSICRPLPEPGSDFDYGACSEELRSIWTSQQP